MRVIGSLSLELWSTNIIKSLSLWVPYAMPLFELNTFTPPIHPSILDAGMEKPFGIIHLSL